MLFYIESTALRLTYLDDIVGRYVPNEQTGFRVMFLHVLEDVLFIVVCIAIFAAMGTAIVVADIRHADAVARPTFSRHIRFEFLAR